MADLHWSVGFLEGEGCFVCPAGRARVVATQVCPDSLYRLRKLFGGIVLEKGKIRAWQLSGINAAGLMMTLWSLMPTKRKWQIEKALAIWRSHLPHARYRITCPQGHPYDIIERTKNGKDVRRCITCRRLYGHTKGQRGI